MVAVKKLAMYLIPLIVLVFSTSGYFGESGMFNEIKDMGENVRDAAPNVSAGMAKLTAEKVLMSGEHEAQFKSFKKAIEELLNTSETKCFGSYLPFTDFAENPSFYEDVANSVKLTINYDSVKDESFLTMSTAKGQIRDIQNYSFKPCVVAGYYSNSHVATNFFNHYLY